MSRRMIRGKPSAETLRKRRYRARLRRASDPAGNFLRRHQRKLAMRQPEPFDPTFDMDAFRGHAAQDDRGVAGRDGDRAMNVVKEKPRERETSPGTSPKGARGMTGAERGLHDGRYHHG